MDFKGEHEKFLKKYLINDVIKIISGYSEMARNLEYYEFFSFENLSINKKKIEVNDVYKTKYNEFFKIVEIKNSKGYYCKRLIYDELNNVRFINKKEKNFYNTLYDGYVQLDVNKCENQIFFIPKIQLLNKRIFINRYNFIYLKTYISYYTAGTDRRDSPDWRIFDSSESWRHFHDSPTD